MSKKGVSKISGNPTPAIGEKTTYIVTDWYPSTPAGERNPAAVTWELFKKEPTEVLPQPISKKKGMEALLSVKLPRKILIAWKRISMNPKAAARQPSILLLSLQEHRKLQKWNSAMQMILRERCSAIPTSLSLKRFA